MPEPQLQKRKTSPQYEALKELSFSSVNEDETNRDSNFNSTKKNPSSFLIPSSKPQPKLPSPPSQSISVS